MRDTVLVWIDADEATLVRWRDDEAGLDTVASDVPPRRRSTGHVRHDPSVRHGGGGLADDEGHREEHLARFIAAVADRVAPDEDVLILGPGTVRDRLHSTLVERDGARGPARSVASEACDRRTTAQLVERLRGRIGQAAPRREVGGR